MSNYVEEFEQHPPKNILLVRHTPIFIHACVPHILWFFDKILKLISLTARSLSDSGAMCCMGRPCRNSEGLSPSLDSPCLEGGFSPFLDGGISPFLEGGFSPFLDGGGSSRPLDGGGLSPCLDPCLDGGT